MRTPSWLVAASCFLTCTVFAAADGGTLYAQHCAACHQGEGQGTVGLAPPLKGSHWLRLGNDRTYLPTVLLHGLSGPIVIDGVRLSGSMPAFGQVLDDAALASVANHLQQVIQGRQDALYTESELRAAREAGGSPPKSRERRAQALK